MRAVRRSRKSIDAEQGRDATWSVGDKGGEVAAEDASDAVRLTNTGTLRACSRGSAESERAALRTGELIQMLVVPSVEEKRFTLSTRETRISGGSGAERLRSDSTRPDGHGKWSTSTSKIILPL